MEPKAGDVILNKFELVRVLGKGGMGIVFAARHRELDALVALKFLLPELRDNAELCERFGREARTLMRIKNEHVARVYDAGTFDGIPFMVMEHLSGQDLAALIRQRGPLPIAESVDLLLQACVALAEAHKLGIVHRDLKPGNLFVTDGARFLKVLDFGISKAPSAHGASLTVSKRLLGSPRYMSPEQLHAPSSVDARSDVWALGLILYEMLTGTPAFAEEAFPTLCKLILDGSYTKLSERRPGVPVALEQVLSETLALDREARVPSVEALAARLAPFGTDAARASQMRIQHIVAAAPASAERPLDHAHFESPPTLDGSDATPPGQVTNAKPGLTGSRAEPQPASRRWRRTTALGAAGVAAVALAILLPRAGRAPLATSPSPAASTSDPPGRAGAADPADCVPGKAAESEARCAAKQPGSCYELAKILEKGACAPKDPARAAALYQTACDGAVLAACNDLGALYARGDGVARDDAKAVTLYERSCDQGYAAACVNLGAMHFEGKGLPKNESLGARLFSRGCEAGEPLGCLNVGIAYGEGRGVPRDAARSFTFADRACAGGVLQGCVRTAVAKIAGDGTAKDVKGGIDQLDALCTRGEPTACESLASLYAKGRGTDIPADPLRVREYTKKACDLGAKASCDVDRLLGTSDKGDEAAAQANELFEARCNSGSFAACDMLGENLLAGIGASVDRGKGMALLEKACKGGFERACKKVSGERATR